MTLWTATVYCLRNGKSHWICGIPALFMTGVVSTYIFYAPEGLKLSYQLSMTIGIIITVAVTFWYVYQIRRHHQQTIQTKAAA